MFCFLFNYFSRTIKWKNSIDENARLSDGSFLPCLLIQNKVDLVSEEVIEQTDEIKEFVEKNNFVDFFRSSAKAGINVNEGMEYIIDHIIAKQEAISIAKGSEINDNDKKSIVLDPKKNHYNLKDKKTDCC